MPNQFQLQGIQAGMQAAQQGAQNAGYQTTQDYERANRHNTEMWNQIQRYEGMLSSGKVPVISPDGRVVLTDMDKDTRKTLQKNLDDVVLSLPTYTDVNGQRYYAQPGTMTGIDSDLAANIALNKKYQNIEQNKIFQQGIGSLGQNGTVYKTLNKIFANPQLPHNPQDEREIKEGMKIMYLQREMSPDIVQRERQKYYNDVTNEIARTYNITQQQALEMINNRPDLKSIYDDKFKKKRIFENAGFTVDNNGVVTNQQGQILSPEQYKQVLDYYQSAVDELQNEKSTGPQINNPNFPALPSAQWNTNIRDTNVR